jgi:hypothetical protein
LIGHHKVGIDKSPAPLLGLRTAFRLCALRLKWYGGDEINLKEGVAYQLDYLLSDTENNKQSLEVNLIPTYGLSCPKPQFSNLRDYLWLK